MWRLGHIRSNLSTMRHAVCWSDNDKFFHSLEYTSFRIKKNGTRSTNNDAAALKTHYTKYHQDHVNIDISLVFSVTFVDKPDRKSRLDFLESVWINRLRAVININKTLLPKVM